MKAIIIARTSTNPKEGQSIPAQVNRLTDYAHKKNFTVDHTFQIIESSARDSRKQFDQIISLSKASKEPVALITDTLDHLQGSLRETPILDELRKAGKIEIHFLREGFVLNKASNSSDLMRWNLGAIFSSYYCRQISDKEMCLL